MDAAPNDARDLAEMITRLRVDHGMSQQALADRAGISVRAISDLERGVTRRPHRDTVRAIAGALRVDPATARGLERMSRAAPPPTRTLRRPQINVPEPPAPLLGREDDLAEVLRLVRAPEVRLVTVTGPGGIGKTRLATEVALRQTRPVTRVDLLDLADLGSAEELPDAVAAVLGCRSPGTHWVETIGLHMGTAGWLLLVEGFESLPASAPGLGDLLTRCPGLTLLVTSRIPVRVRGEHLWPLAPLALPAPGTGRVPHTTPHTAAHTTADLDRLAAVPAVGLFLARARAARPGFALTRENADDVSRLCRRLAGLPLALELAAAQVRTQSPAAILEGLDGALHGREDEDRSRRAPAALGETVRWATGHLTPEAAEILRLLAAFTGGAGLDSLRDVAGRCGSTLPHLHSSLAVLVSTGLATVTDHAGTVRVGLPDAVREIVSGFLDEHPDGERVRLAHSRHFLTLLAGAADGTEAGQDPDLFPADTGNIRAAVVMAVRRAPRTVDLPTVRGLFRVGMARGQLRTLRAGLGGIATAVEEPLVRAFCCYGAGVAADRGGDPRTAADLAHTACDLLEDLHDVSLHCAALTLLGDALRTAGESDPARQAYERCLVVARDAGDTGARSLAHHHLGTLARDRGDHAAAQEHFSAGLDGHLAAGDRSAAVATTLDLAGVALDTGQVPRALDLLRTAVTGARELAVPRLVGHALALLAEASVHAGAPGPATTAAVEALQLSRDAGYAPGIGTALRCLGDLARERGEAERAQQLYREALDHLTGARETARTLEHLAEACLDSDPEEAVHLLRDAERTRAARGTPVPPLERHAVARTRHRAGLEEDRQAVGVAPVTPGARDVEEAPAT